ncbi:efflux RND transporter permease subunit [Tamlana flava]|uniref:efflux RND transporter permease subunit n=1 Tax=Tamlana flava TaxID=3158572 RepID=UPI00351ACD51
MNVFNIYTRILLASVFILGSFFVVPYVTYDNSINRWLPEESNSIKSYKTFLEDFNSDAMLIVSLETENNSATRKKIAPYIKKIREIDYVLNVVSWPSKDVQHKTNRFSNQTVYLIHFEPKSHLNPNRPELIDTIHNIFQELKIPYHLAGTGVIFKEINAQTSNNSGHYLIIGLALLMLTTIIIIRSSLATIQTLVLALSAVSSIIYAAALFKISISIAHTIIPVIILFYSTSISMHILSHGGDFRKVISPSIWVIITTAIGFTSFIFSSIPLLQDFAILGLIGLIAVFLFALLIFYPKAYSYNLNPYFFKIENFKLLPFSKALLLFIFILAVSVPGMSKLKSEIHSLSVLSKNSSAYKDHAFIESTVGPYFPMEFTVDASKIERISIVKWIHEVYDIEEVGALISYHRLSPFINKKLAGYQSKSNNNIYRITFLIPLISTNQGIELVNKINQISDKHFTNEKPKLTGYITLYTQVAADLLNAFKNSLVWAFILIFIVMMIYLKNWKLVLIVMLVNVFPIVTMLGLMGSLGINLDMVTIPIGCLLLSIVVDDTIHYLYWYKKTGELKEALHKSGIGIILTTTVICLGFGVLMISEVPPIRYFGFLSVFALIIALISDLILMPAFIKKILKTGVKQLVNED